MGQSESITWVCDSAAGGVITVMGFDTIVP